MKKIINLVLGLIVILTVKGQITQTQTIGTPKTLVINKGVFKSDSAFQIATRDTLNHPYRTLAGVITRRAQDGLLYVTNGSTWKNLPTKDLLDAKASIVQLADSTANLQTQINTKQPTLTAGSNISIVGNTISSTGGGGGSSIYTADGTLAGNRIITQGVNDLSFNGTGKFIIGGGALPPSGLGRIPPNEPALVQLGTNKVLVGDMSAAVGAPNFIEFLKSKNNGSGYGIPQGVRASTGFLGSTEFNTSVNMDYTTGSHKYYDSTVAAIWSYLGTQNGFGIQYVPANNPNNSIFYNYGNEILQVVPYGQPSTGVAKRLGSEVRTSSIRLADNANLTLQNDENQDWLFRALGNNLKITTSYAQANPTTAIIDVALPKIFVSNTGQDGFTTNADVASFRSTRDRTSIVLYNDNNNSNGNRLYFLKLKGGSYNVNAGTIAADLNVNTVANYQIVATANAPGGFSNFEHRWLTQNTSGTTAQRMVLSENGNLGINTNTPLSLLDVQSTTQGVTPYPRMTSAQRTAIASPAIGLHVYQTDGTEGVYINKSTGWVFAY
jgi:hypothetical protein